MNPDYIPGGNTAFFEWQEFLTGKVNVNGAAWGIPATVVSELDGRSTAYGLLYQSISNKQVRTPQQVEAHRVGRREFTTFLRQLVQGSLVNNALIPFDEKRAMGLNPRGGRGSRPQIEDIPVLTLSAMGGGRVRFEVRMPNTTGRARMHPASNGAELRVYFTKAGGLPPRTSEPGEPLPQPTESHEVHTVLRTRAVFTEDTDMQGHTLHMQARYVNTSAPSKSGPWSNEVTVVVS